MNNDTAIEILRKMDKIISLLEALVPQEHDVTLPTFPEFSPKPNACSRCKMEFYGASGYACQSSDCPMGLGPMAC